MIGIIRNIERWSGTTVIILADEEGREMAYGLGVSLRDQVRLRDEFEGNVIGARIEYHADENGILTHFARADRRERSA